MAKYLMCIQTGISPRAGGRAGWGEGRPGEGPLPSPPASPTAAPQLQLLSPLVQVQSVQFRPDFTLQSHLSALPPEPKLAVSGFFPREFPPSPTSRHTHSYFYLSLAWGGVTFTTLCSLELSKMALTRTPRSSCY